MKKGFEISFAWLFAILVGIFILALAIYGATRMINLGRYEISTKTGKEIGILLNPLETGFETGVTTSLTLPTETRIYNECDNWGSFGRQIISVSQKSFGRWPEPADGVSFKNKYIFSGNVSEGKRFYIFSKPFEFPFKVADLIYLTPESEKYCFSDAPERIREELEDLGQENIFLKNCPDDSIKVCFSGKKCDIEVDYDKGKVVKEGNVYFEGDALMYAAIFSDKDVYECQLKRLMERITQLALIYRNKAVFISQKGCTSNLNTDLLVLENSAGNWKESKDIIQIKSYVKDIEKKNEISSCRLW